MKYEKCSASIIPKKILMNVLYLFFLRFSGNATTSSLSAGEGILTSFAAADVAVMYLHLV